MADSNEITEEQLPYYLADISKKDKRRIQKNVISPLTDTINKVESIMIRKALRMTVGNITKAAELLEIPRQTLQYKISKYDINIDAEK